MNRDPGDLRTRLLAQRSGGADCKNTALQSLKIPAADVLNAERRFPAADPLFKPQGLI